MEYIRLKDIFNIRKGRKVEQLEKKIEGAIRYLQIDDLRNNNNIKYCINNKYVLANKEDIIIAWDGANAGTINYGLEGAIGSTLAVLSKNGNELDTEYCGLFLKSKFTYLRDKCTGATIPHISRSSLEDLEIPKFNLQSQKKIVKSINLAQSLIDKRKTQIEALDEMVKSRFIEMFGNPKDNIKGWEVKKLGDIFKVGSSRRIYQSEQTLSGVPFLRISNLVQRIETGSNSSELYISEEQYNSFKEKALVPLTGDILVTSRGTIGVCYIVQESDRFYFQDGMISWLKRWNTDINSIYIKNLFGMKGFRKQIDEIPTGTTVNYLSISRLADLDVMYPNIVLQNQFADFVNQVDKLKFEMEKSLKELEDNFNSLMEKAFKGELFN